MWGVHITGSHVVPLCWPVYAGIVLHIQLLARDSKGQPGQPGASTWASYRQKLAHKGMASTVVFMEPCVLVQQDQLLPYLPQAPYKLVLFC